MAFQLNDEQAQILDLNEFATEREVQKRVNLLESIYTNPRFAPADATNRLMEMRAVCEELGIEPVAIERGDSKYCGNYYLLPNARMGTPAECMRKGEHWGDKHGKVPT